MQTVIYHQVEPQATQPVYKSFDNVDFVINAPRIVTGKQLFA